MKSYYLILAFIIIIIPMVSAIDETIAPVEQGKCAYIYQTCDNCTYVNITAIVIQSLNYSFDGGLMAKKGTYYDYNSFCNTSTIGIYRAMTCGDCDGSVCCEPVSFEVTTSGREAITDGESTSLIIAIVIMLIISGIFFLFGYKVENLAGKIILIGTGIILLLASFLFSLVTMNQILGGFAVILEGYTTFWFIVKIIFGIALTALTVFVLWFSYQAFMIRKGFRD